MISAPYLKTISIYPVKSLDRLVLGHVKVLKSGALQYDREFALVDGGGNFINGKRSAKVHLLRSHFDTERGVLFLQIGGSDRKASFDICHEKQVLESWLSDYFDLKVNLLQNPITGFPDDTHARGPTVISTATIEEIATWFPEMSGEEMRVRLRANLEIDGVPPFWEDRLFAEAGKVVSFKIGDVMVKGINPCQRCIVPTRHSQTGEKTANFQKIFVTKRRESLPSWVESSRFNHFYRVSVNTNIPESEAGKTLSEGDALEILGIHEDS